MRFQCSHCRGILAIEDFEPGEAVACGHCGSAVAIPETRVSAGSVVGDFVIREKLGEGGMGAVYLAHQVSLDRSAALKVLHARYGHDQSYIKDFIHEARAAAALNHPNIVQAYAVGEDDGLFYFAMEYVPGSTLKQVLLHGGRMVADRALDIGIQVAAALEFGWKHQGLIHRDIKPDNIILTGEGTVKLADLGLARKMTETASDGTQELYGTPQYIAPEQLLGHSGDNRSDIYSLGATLYHAVTGHFPYEGTDPTDIAQKHLAEPLPAPREVCPEVPEAFNTVIQIMLAKRPLHRYQDAADVVKDLERVRGGGVPAVSLPGDAQDPIDLYSDEAVAIADGVDPAPDAKRKKSRGKTRMLSVSKAVGRRPAGGQDDQETAAPASAEEAGVGATPTRVAKPDAADENGGGRKRLAMGLVALAVVLCVIGAVAVFMILPGGEDPDSRTGSRPRGLHTGGDGTTTVTEGLTEIRQAIAQGAPAASVTEELAAFAERHGYDHDQIETFAELAAPYREKALAEKRRQLHENEQRQWEARAETLRQQKAEEDERQRREAAAEAERKRQEQEARQRAEETARQEARRRQERNDLRWKAVELCRQHAYDEASRLFVPMAASRDEDAHEWARAKQDAISMAKELFNSIVNSKDQLAGLALPVPRQRKEWLVTDIGFTEVELEQHRTVYEKGERKEVVRTLEIPLADLSAVQIDTLTRRQWELDGKDDSERQLLFGAYLLARGRYPSEARKRLRASDAPKAEVFLNELDALEPVVRKREALRILEQLRDLTQQGEMRKARALLNYLKRTFPEEAEKHADTIRSLTPRE